MSIPRVIKNYQLSIDGIGYAGKVPEVRLPQLRILEEEHRVGGMDAAVGIDMGMEKMEVGFNMDEHVAAVIRRFGLASSGAVSFTFRAAQADDTTVAPYVIMARGNLVELDLGTVQHGQKNPLSATISCRVLTITINGQELIHIDAEGMKRRIGGVDQLQAIRNAIGV